MIVSSSGRNMQVYWNIATVRGCDIVVIATRMEDREIGVRFPAGSGGLFLRCYV